jgi:hypothetical protein
MREVESIYFDDKTYKEDKVETPEVLVKNGNEKNPEVHIAWVKAPEVWAMGKIYLNFKKRIQW